MTDHHCHYCGAVYTRGSGDTSREMIEHLRQECRDVPEMIRQQYGQSCAFGNCSI